MRESNLYDPDVRWRMQSQPCRCCLMESIRAFRSADSLCLRCHDAPGIPFFLPSGRGLVSHSCKEVSGK